MAMTFASERGSGLVLDVVADHRSVAIHLYERLGWKLVGRRPAGWVLADGRRPQLRLYVLPGDSPPT
jgi:ribosomal protein S18 acetylase RimI-like enzyme